MDLRKAILLKKPLQESSFSSLNSSNQSIYESAAEDSDNSLYFSFSNSITDTSDLLKENDLNSSENDTQTEEDQLLDTSIVSEADKENTVIMRDIIHDSPDSDERRKESFTEKTVSKEAKESEEICKSSDEHKEVNIEEKKTECVTIEIEVPNEIESSKLNKTFDSKQENMQTEENDLKISEPLHAEKNKINETQVLSDSESLHAHKLEENKTQEDKSEVSEPMEVDDESKQVQQPEEEIVYPFPPVEIIIEDPNENIINPFTAAISEVNTPSSFISTPSTNNDTHSSNNDTPSTSTCTQNSIINTPESSINTQQNQDKAKSFDQKAVKKRTPSRIPTKKPYSSPLRRKSVDKKSKVIVKPTLQRRTIYETRSQITVNKTKIQPIKATTSVAATAQVKSKSKPPVVTKPTTLKAVIHKCKIAGCEREFRSLKTLQDHTKSHNSSSSSSIPTVSSASTFKCKWCDKNFVLESILINHMQEKCPKIPFNEKRKLLLQEDVKQKQQADKRKSVFAAPIPKKRSPRRQTMNKSGIIITPKKTLKCHASNCGKLFTDVIEFANHTVAHKYENTIKSQNNA